MRNPATANRTQAKFTRAHSRQRLIDFADLDARLVAQCVDNLAVFKLLSALLGISVIASAQVGIDFSQPVIQFFFFFFQLRFERTNPLRQPGFNRIHYSHVPKK